MLRELRIPSCCAELDSRSRTLTDLDADLGIVLERLSQGDIAGGMDMLDYIRSVITSHAPAARQ